MGLQGEVEAVLQKEQGGYSFTKVIMQPILTIATGGDQERGIRLLEKAERSCLISRSVIVRLSCSQRSRSRSLQRWKQQFVSSGGRMPNATEMPASAGKSAFHSMSREDLLRSLEMFAKNWLAHDGCWFLAAEESLGMEAAIDLDTTAWQRFAVTEANRIMSTFDVLEASQHVRSFDQLSNHAPRENVLLFAGLLVDPQRSHLVTDPEWPINRGQQFCDRRQIRLRQRDNGWPRAAETNSQQVFMLQLQRLRQAGHNPLAERLMQTISQRLLQQGKIAALQRLQ